MKQLLLICAVVALVGCGKKRTGNAIEGSTSPVKTTKKTEKRTPSKGSLETFLPGKKILFKVPGSENKGIFVFNESGSFSLGNEKRFGILWSDFPGRHYQIDGLEVELPNRYFLVFPSNTPLVGDSISVRGPARAKPPESLGKATSQAGKNTKIHIKYTIEKILRSDEIGKLHGSEY